VSVFGFHFWSKEIPVTSVIFAKTSTLISLDNLEILLRPPDSSGG